MDLYRSSGRKPFWKLLLSGIIYMVLGNIMCAIMTISTAPLIGEMFMKIIVFILAIAIFYCLVFTVAYKDGDNEQRYVRLHHADPPKDNKWVIIGLAMLGVMTIPSLVLLLDKLCGWYFDFTLVHRIIDGMVYPLSLILVPESSIDSMGVFVPFIYILCYCPIPAVTHLGFYYGYTQKLDKDKIMYE